MKNKMKIMIVIVLGIALVVGGCILCFLPKNTSQNEPVINDNKPVEEIEEVEPSKAREMYEETISSCSGALVWDLKVGDIIQIKDKPKNVCKNENYYSKMVGYTYDTYGNVIIHVNVLKKVGTELRKLDDTFVDQYNEDELDLILNHGTTYEYVYQKDGEAYKLIEVHLMPLP